jgi:hypothetical protein
VSPFHDLGQRCRGPLSAESAWSLPSSGTSAAGGRPGANTELQVVSLPRFVRLLSLGVLGLAGLLSLGIGGVVLVQGHVLRASKVGTRELMGASRHAETSSSLANARRESGASARTTAGGPSTEVLGSGARQQRWAAPSRNQPETLESAYVETATAP